MEDATMVPCWVCFTEACNALFELAVWHNRHCSFGR